jgi:hypothetical protein
MSTAGHRSSTEIGLSVCSVHRKPEVVTMPASDVSRAKEVYARLEWAAGRQVAHHGYSGRTGRQPPPGRPNYGQSDARRSRSKIHEAYQRSGAIKPLRAVGEDGA